MKLPKELTTVTPISKALALLMFIVIPICAFFIGMNYKQMVDMSQKSTISVIEKTMSTPIPSPTIITLLDTSSWQSYINTKYGYSFKFLPNLKTDGNDSEGVTLVISTCTGLCGVVLGVRINDGYFGVPAGSQAKSITVAGQQATQYLEYYNNEYTQWTIIRMRNHTLEILNHGMNGFSKVDLDTFQPIFQTILSTFIFTNQNQTITPPCMSRPACLNATPRCLILEPAQGWCSQ